MNYESISQPWEERTQTETRLPKRANSRFVFAHNPENWELKMYPATIETDEGKRKKQSIPVLLPVLTSLPETPGVNATRAVGKRLDSSTMRARMQDIGWTLLDASKHDYMRVYPANRGNYHTTKYIRFEQIGRRIIEHFDHEKFDDWRLSLVRDGHINPPHPQIASLMLISMNRAMSRLERDQHIPEVASRLKSKQEKYKNTKKAIDRLEKYGAKAYEL